MIVKQKNKGKKIAYSVKGTVLTLGEKEMVLDLAEYQGEEEVHLTVCYNKRGKLTMDNDGITYVAEIDIPEKEYEEIPDPEDKENKLTQEKPLDMNKVVLTLWALEEKEDA